MTTTLLGEQSEGKSSVRSSGGIAILDETYHHLVEASTVEIERTEVLATVGLPKVGITVSASGFCVCRTVDAVRRKEQRLLWDVTSTFSSEVDERQTPQGYTGDPTTWVPVYETKFERMQEQCTTDNNGDSIANSAGQPFEMGIIRGRYIPVWEFFQIEAGTVSDETVIERNEVVNDAVFKGRAARTLLCTVISSVVGFYYGSLRRLTRYSLRYNSFNWRHKRLDLGTVYFEGGEFLPYFDNPRDKNVILGGLNGAGGKVAAGAKPAILQFDVYPEATFTDFLRL